MFALTALVALMSWLLPPQITRYRAYREKLERDRVQAELDRLILARLAVTNWIVEDREDSQIEYVCGNGFWYVDGLEQISNESRAGNSVND